MPLTSNFRETLSKQIHFYIHLTLHVPIADNFDIQIFSVTNSSRHSIWNCQFTRLNEQVFGKQQAIKWRLHLETLCNSREEVVTLLFFRGTRSTEKFGRKCFPYIKILTKRLFVWSSQLNFVLLRLLRSRKPKLTAVGMRCADHATPSTRKSWH
jgi:hypothetical protein